MSARDFERALVETRASVTKEVVEEYEEISRMLKESAVRGREGIGF